MGRELYKSGAEKNSGHPDVWIKLWRHFEAENTISHWEQHLQGWGLFCWLYYWALGWDPCGQHQHHMPRFSIQVLSLYLPKKFLHIYSRSSGVLQALIMEAANPGVRKNRSTVTAGNDLWMVADEMVDKSRYRARRSQKCEEKNFKQSIWELNIIKFEVMFVVWKDYSDWKENYGTT